MIACALPTESYGYGTDALHLTPSYFGPHIGDFPSNLAWVSPDMQKHCVGETNDEFRIRPTGVNNSGSG
jgi:hypothetical protein